ncbi:MAG: Flp pilus assembly protein CpaB [Anaerolineae bacterium]|uniref:Flp pilus assembly protein CpaB n=1 Tax=Thermogutta sp. TaxID=1962930 RepID=UPI00322002FE
MSRRTQIFIGVIALLVAAGTGLLLYANFNRMVTTAQVVTPARTIPVGSLIDESLLTVREVPRPLLSEDIYIRKEDLVGRVATVHLRPGMLIYRTFAVPLREYRLVDDPAYTVVSFPVEPARAVGGQIQPGHRVDIWQLAAVPSSLSAEIGEVIASEWATATILARNILVVDVRAGSGQAVARSPQAVPGQVQQQSSSTGSAGTLQILTVAVPSDTAREILTLVAKQQQARGVTLWVSLSPIQQ